MVKFTVLLGIIAIIVLAWSIGAAIGLWANPVFAPFFIISYNLAMVLSYLGLSAGAFLIALSLIIHYKYTNKETEIRFKLNSPKAHENVRIRNGNWLNAKLEVLLGLVGIVFLVWSIGIAIGLWGNPVFASLWIVSNELANNLSYLGLSVGAFLITSAIIIYYKNIKTDKIFAVDSRLRRRREEFHNYLWEKNQQLINDCNENYPVVVMNGRRTELGLEDMKKIVN
jgi:hypothetical protein